MLLFKIVQNDLFSEYYFISFTPATYYRGKTQRIIILSFASSRFKNNVHRLRTAAQDQLAGDMQQFQNILNAVALKRPYHVVILA